MIEQINKEIRKANKNHRCDLCGKEIGKGERYEWIKNIWEGDFYEFHSHIACSNICSAIWDYADPDEGMDEDLFQDSCREVCEVFVCPDCPYFLKDIGECERDETCCLDRLYEFFKEYELYRAGRRGYAEEWKARKKEGAGCCQSGSQ